MEQILFDFWADLNQAFTNPQKRVFWGFLVSAGLIGFVVLKYQQQQTTRATLKRLFSAKVWLSPSARADYAVFLLNRVLFLLLTPLLITQLAVATWLFEGLHLLFAGRVLVGESWPDWTVMLLFTCCYFIVDDFARFYVHKLLHDIPALWAFHKVHHSARVMTPITVFRAHPVEGLLFSVRTILVQASMLSLFVFFFGSRVDLVTLFGASFIVFFFNVLGANLRHSHIPLRYGDKVERWLISPKQHQIHHSVQAKHFNQNYGVVFAVWDRLNGSLALSEKQQVLRFGLSHRKPLGEHSLQRLYLKPFVDSAKQLKKLIKPQLKN